MIYNFFYPGKYNNYLKTVNSKAKNQQNSGRPSDGESVNQNPDPKSMDEMTSIFFNFVKFLMNMKNLDEEKC